MSEINKVEETKESKFKKINVPKKVKIGLAIAGGVVATGGAIFLISKGINAAKVAKTVTEHAPEVAEAVEKTAEAVL